MQLTLNLLGRFEARQSNSRAPLDFSRKKATALLAFLASPVGRGRSRDELCGLLWGNFADEQARDSLRQTLFVIRKTIPDIVGPFAKRDTLVLDADLISTDVGKFETAAAGSSPTELEQAYELYSGEFLQGFALREDDFERWLSAERRRLENLALSVMERLLMHYRSASRHDAAIQVASRALDIDPLQEDLHRTLIQCYVAVGRIGQAREQYEKCRELLAEDLGIRPSNATERIYSTLLGRKNATRAPLDRTFGAPIIIPNFHTAPIVAVLPFEYSGAGPPMLAETLTPKLIAVLAAALPLTIVDHRSVSLAATQKTSTADLAISFGARYAVEGSIRSWNDRWRTDFSLVDVMTGRHLCTGSCEYTDADLFHLTDTMALQIGAKIANQIETSERNNAADSDIGSADAWQSFNRGMALLVPGRHTDIEPARLAFLRAVEIEPFNARAISGLANSVKKGGIYLVVENRDDAFAEAHELALKAYALDHSDPYVNLILGQTYQWTERFELAGESLKRAFDVMPNHPNFCLAMGNFLSKTGFPEKCITFAAQVPDFSAERALIVARCYLQLRSYNKALDWSERTIQISPHSAWARVVMASALGHLDRSEEAFAALLACEDLRPGHVNAEFQVRPTQYKDPHEQDHILAGVLKAGGQP
ncbi:MAG: BTAD domain-containing putative transcriptional regulator [Paracoccaceae bacterium]